MNGESASKDDVHRLSETLRELKSDGAIGSSATLTKLIKEIYPEFNDTTLKHLTSAKSKISKNQQQILLSALPSIIVNNKKDVWDPILHERFGLNCKRLRELAAEQRGFRIISKEAIPEEKFDYLIGDYLIFRINDQGHSRPVSRSGLRIRKKNSELVTNTVRFDGEMKGISTQGRIIIQSKQYIAAAYTRSAGLAYGNQMEYDGGLSIISFPIRLVSDNKINEDKLRFSTGLHFQSTHDISSNFSRLIIVRFDDFFDTSDFKIYFEKMVQIFGELITIGEAREELSTRSGGIHPDFFHRTSNEGKTEGALVNCSVDDGAIASIHTIPQIYLPTNEL